MRLDYSPSDGTLFRINPPGNYRRTNSSPQPQHGQSGKRLCQRTTSSSSMTCCLLVSEPLALTLLLQPHSATHIKSLQFHVCEDKNPTPCSCSSYSQIHIMDCFFLPRCRYGFGLLDAGLMVQQAAHFHSVPSQKKCTQEVTLDPAR